MNASGNPPDGLLEVLSDAQRLGYLGPSPLEAHVRHSLGFVVATGRLERGPVMDLGSGAGVPGLILALAWPEVSVVLLESNQRRAAFLEAAVRRLHIDPVRVTVEPDRAENVGRLRHWRGSMALIVARAFGPPAVVAECAAPLLRIGGRLLVSEPPEDAEERWPPTGLAQLGLVSLRALRGDAAGYQILEQREECPERFPRGVGRPGKRPLF